jgi:hypothetical protein
MGRSTSTEDIKVTPEMVEAGCRVFADYDARLESPGRVVTEIFQAMWRESLRNYLSFEHLARYPKIRRRLAE